MPQPAPMEVGLTGGSLVIVAFVAALAAVAIGMSLVFRREVLADPAWGAART